MRRAIAALTFTAIVLGTTIPAQARQAFDHPQSMVDRYGRYYVPDRMLGDGRKTVRQVKRVVKKTVTVAKKVIEKPVEVARTITAYAQQIAKVSWAKFEREKFPKPLVQLADVIADRCKGFKVISGSRPGAVVAGSGRPSLHSFNKAIDITGKDYKCAYRVIAEAKFRGGVSMDAWRVAHIHISYDDVNGREMGARFQHYRPRYASR